MTEKKIVFVGDSITHGGNWNKLLGREDCVNKGIPGDKTTEVLARMDDIAKVPARRYFLMIGINDLGYRTSVADITANTKKILKRLHEAHSDADIRLQGVLPVNEKKSNWGISNQTINQVNAELRAIADGEDHIAYVDVSSALSDESGDLRAGFTYDGVHLTPAGYVEWAEVIRSHVDDRD